MIIVAILAVFIANKMSWQGGDFSIMSIEDDKVELVNISPERGMVNSYLVQNTDLWIPNGMGWYPAERLSLIVKEDKNLVRLVSFYNFGFWPKDVLFGGGWNNNKYLGKVLGPIGWIRYKLSAENWLFKKEVINLLNLDEVMSRDMADSQFLLADIKINVINASDKNGFGNMMADRLEWFGLMVTSVQTAEYQDTCQLSFDFNSAKQNNSFEILNLLSNILSCTKVDKGGVPEIVLGAKLEEMVKYSQTYVRSL